MENAGIQSLINTMRKDENKEVQHWISQINIGNVTIEATGLNEEKGSKTLVEETKVPESPSKIVTSPKKVENRETSKEPNSPIKTDSSNVEDKESELTQNSEINSVSENEKDSSENNQDSTSKGEENA